MREIAHQKCLQRLLFVVLPTPHSRGPRTDFHAKYVKRRGSAQGCAFSVLEKNKTLNSLIAKTPILGSILTGQFFSAENRFTMGDAHM